MKDEYGEEIGGDYADEAYTEIKAFCKELKIRTGMDNESICIALERVAEDAWAINSILKGDN